MDILSGSLEEHTVCPATPGFGSSDQLETRGGHLFQDGRLRCPVPAVALRSLGPTDPVHDPARLEVNDRKTTTRTQRAENVGVDGVSVGQMMVGRATEECVAPLLRQVGA